ncbi:hypothetical protein HZH66_014993 [Vespula vulgaris]|uniref:Uncharacterized protein n=1 Tax=Vespula vulgaris TaxID=7454 RepID=A0A834IXY8_VESVU|nr:hypothetical protein HZH66_014993 [Vespula vulgaris]
MHLEIALGRLSSKDRQRNGFKEQSGKVAADVTVIAVTASAVAVAVAVAIAVACCWCSCCRWVWDWTDDAFKSTGGVPRQMLAKHADSSLKHTAQQHHHQP